MFYFISNVMFKWLVVRDKRLRLNFWVGSNINIARSLAQSGGFTGDLCSYAPPSLKIAPSIYSVEGLGVYGCLAICTPKKCGSIFVSMNPFVVLIRYLLLCICFNCLQQTILHYFFIVIIFLKPQQIRLLAYEVYSINITLWY